MPAFDSEPIFGKLLDSEGGSFLISGARNERGTQTYIPNTNVIATRIETADGVFRVIDFAPRFFQHGRSFRPTQIIRIVEHISGSPRLRIDCSPVLGWSKQVPRKSFESHHIDFEGYPARLRLTTDVSLSYLNGQPFTLTQTKYLALTWGAPIEEPLAPLASRFRDETIAYWRGWVRHTNIPADYQSDVIRSALALKLHCFEDTGAIVAAMTTSIPESPDSGRTWDYRYCWLRDAYYVLGAFRLLGHFEERDKFVEYLINITAAHPHLDLSPLYRINGSSDLTEVILENWHGYEGGKPVRVGNGAATQQQNDVFGEMVLALAPVFLDERFTHDQTDLVLGLLKRLTRKAGQVAGTPDAGIWEFRTRSTPQTFSSLMSFAAADRMTLICERRGSPDADEYRALANRLRNEIISRSWNNQKNTFVSIYDGSDLDAALLQIVGLRLLPRDDGRLSATVDAIIADLSKDGLLLRYRAPDDFGTPDVAFTLCTFWLVEALASLGRLTEAREFLDRARLTKSQLGLFSEDYDTQNKRMWGNFPQGYSHVGLIHAAFAASREWPDMV